MNKNYILVNNGVMIQWGRVYTQTTIPDVISFSISFPVAFKNAYMVQLTGIEPGDIFMVTYLSSTSFTYWGADRIVQTQVYNRLYWLAIGQVN